MTTITRIIIITACVLALALAIAAYRVYGTKPGSHARRHDDFEPELDDWTGDQIAVLHGDSERIPGDDTLIRMMAPYLANAWPANGILPATPLEPVPVLSSPTGAGWEEPAPWLADEDQISVAYARETPGMEPTTVIGPRFGPPADTGLLARYDRLFPGPPPQRHAWPAPSVEVMVLCACETCTLIGEARDWAALNGVDMAAAA